MGLSTGQRLSNSIAMVGSKSASVGLLIHPQSKLLDIQPALVSHWSPNCIAASAKLEGESLLLVNVYAPVNPHLREEFYDRIAGLEILPGVQLSVGGGFNCTQHGLQDRSYEPTASGHYSKALARLAGRWGLNGSLANALPHEEDQGDYNGSTPSSIRTATRSTGEGWLRAGWIAGTGTMQHELGWWRRR